MIRSVQSSKDSRQRKRSAPLNKPEVNDNKVKVITIDNKEFIFLTDLARYANLDEK